MEKYGRARKSTHDNMAHRHRVTTQLQLINNIIIIIMPFACWIPQVTNALSEYVILIDFLLQQWLRGEYPSLLR
jgi:hypothetical protein